VGGEDGGVALGCNPSTFETQGVRIPPHSPILRTDMIQHKHLIIRAEIMKPPKQFEVDKTETWFRNLIEKRLKMKILSGPHIKYVEVPGNAGATGVAIIETSHVAMHVWDETSPAIMQLDVYTCGEMEPSWVLDALDAFEPVKVEYTYLDREKELKTLSSGIIL
jgi:S-adenosylmethionine/arginine decarboxylase-like enzyme